MINRISIEVKPPQSIAWEVDKLVDWTSGRTEYDLAGNCSRSSFSLAYDFDAVKISSDGSVVIVYQKLGTKGVVFKNGQIIREINRSFYHADTYEYPIEILECKEVDKDLIIHCPEDYCRLEIQDINTGEVLTNKTKRIEIDNFFSRLESNGSYVLSAGWAWHPFDILNVYNIAQVLNDPTLLDHSGIGPAFSAEISSARFYKDSQIIIATANEGKEEDDGFEIRSNRIAYYNLESKSIDKQITLDFEFGNVIAIDDDFVLDLMNYPKVINMNTGKIEAQFEDIKTGAQRSSIIHHLEHLPSIAINKKKNKIAITTDKGIEVLSFVN